jgi:hypothetical protein
VLPDWEGKMAGSGLPGRLPLIFRFSRSASLPDGRRVMQSG